VNCEAPGCKRAAARSRKYCPAHYSRLRRYGTLTVEVRAYARTDGNDAARAAGGCPCGATTLKAHGLCRRCYELSKRPAKPPDALAERLEAYWASVADPEYYSDVRTQHVIPLVDPWPGFLARATRRTPRAPRCV
jgi:hypothetical protein